LSNSRSISSAEAVKDWLSMYVKISVEVKFMQTVQEIYAASIRPLGESERLRIAALILEEITQSRQDKQVSDAEKTLARQRLRQFAGSVGSGNANSSDNEQIDKDLALESLNAREDES
jgi:hypothetical protein